MTTAAVAGAFDDLRSRDIRFLEEARASGSLTVFLWSDPLIERLMGKKSRFPEAERRYFLQAIRFVDRVYIVEKSANEDTLPDDPQIVPPKTAAWIVREHDKTHGKERFCKTHGLRFQVLSDSDLEGFRCPASSAANSTRKKVIVTGCYDWLHSGHVRFFEEVSALGDLYVVIGHDANISLLKGPGHPLLCQDERRYVVGSIRHVKEALISTGHGWLDAEPEIARIKPDIYAVNEDGDKGGKREFCEKHGIEYVVLKRQPAAGLASRTSTDLRGF